MSPVSSAAINALDEIERIEARSLTWGYVDGSFSYEELEDMCAAVASRDDFDDILEILLDRALLFEVTVGTNTIRYRSRFAESIRLLTQLRQLFPKKSISTAPRLVSDFRINIRKRQFPSRTLLPDAVLEDFKHSGSAISELQLKAWEALTHNLNLAGFQWRGFQRIFSSNDGDGTIITAGTGSGKTLAFYLPALTKIVEYISVGSSWVKCLAIYPRRELLKDQFSEVFRQVRLLDPILAQSKRSVRIGALFGDTPRTLDDVSKNWKHSANGLIFPGMRCPQDGCGADLIWTFENLKLNLERLSCSSSNCFFTIPDGSIAFTRESMLANPPDILFTTTEMLNQRLSDPKLRRLFGINQDSRRKPLFALLDEVHTYVDVHGAQSALALRRFRHSLGRPIPFIGLSATLAEADRFFAELVGLSASRVVEISPFPAEMVHEGAEYQILLSSDPSASTLSTSIQAAFLLGRLLDSDQQPISQGSYGKRLFVFTDDLDVTNRLYDNLKDAEGYDIFGKADPARTPLANLRDKNAGIAGYDSIGQRWRLCELINRPLNKRLLLGRTTSQDGGVDSVADVIVATSSLEVGYNDPFVGAVLQHKAPRNAASFLQRKGRAGRTRAMRPMTVTVLSDYGRDRIAFQAYEHLFDPYLPPQSLPVKNDFILRIQAVYSLIDYLSTKLPDGNSTWLWAALSIKNQAFARTRDIIIDILSKLLDGDKHHISDLESWLKDALDIDSDILDRLLWQPPRSIMLEVIPTLHRRLIREWRLWNNDGDDALADWHPLPDFMPRSLFGELNLPEVEIQIPAPNRGGIASVESVPIERALSQFTPGNVTRRFAVQRGALSHWFPLAYGDPHQTIRISEYCKKYEGLGFFGDGDDRIAVYRPRAIAVSRVRNNEVLPTSRSTFNWRTELLARGECLMHEVPRNSLWRERLGDLKFYLHKFRGAVLVRRFAHDAVAELHSKRDRTMSRVNFVTDDGQPAALGFEFDADGLSFDVTLPSADTLTNHLLSPSLLATCRSAYFRSRILADSVLPFEISKFHRDWIHRVLLSAGINRAVSRKEPIDLSMLAILEDQAELNKALSKLLRESPATVIEDPEDEEADSEDDQGNSSTKGSRLRNAIESVLHLDEVKERLRELIPEILNPTSKDWEAWLRSSLLESLAEAALQACSLLAPREIATDTLTVDVNTKEHCVPQIWITETSIGGAGVIQTIADSVSADPRAFTRAIECVLARSDIEIAADGLEQYLAQAESYEDVARAAAAVRNAIGHADREQSNDALRKILLTHGLEFSRALSISLQARLFRPGSDAKLDQLLKDLLDAWNSLEAQLQISIGAREFAMAAADDAKLSSAVRSLKNEGGVSDTAVADTISSLMWARSPEVRQRSLQSYSRYHNANYTDPALIREFIVDLDVTRVDVSRIDWHELLSSALAANGIAILESDAQTSILRSRIVSAISTAIPVGFLRFYPMVERIERVGNIYRATMIIREQF